MRRRTAGVTLRPRSCISWMAHAQAAYSSRQRGFTRPTPRAWWAISWQKTAADMGPLG